MAQELHVLVYTFDSVGKAEAGRALLDKLEQQDAAAISQVAVIQKTADGQISLREPRDFREELSGIASAVASSVTWFVYSFVGLLGTPPAVLADQYADDTVHQLVRDSGFPDQALYEIGADLQAGSAAIVALISAGAQPTIVAELEQLGGRVWTHHLPGEVVAQLQRSDEAA